MRVGELYREHSPALVRRLMGKTGCPELARELANDTFVRLLRLQPGRLEQIEEPKAFIWRVATNLLRDWGRARLLRERARPVLDLSSDLVIDQLAALESRDALRRLQEAVDGLKPRTREIFLAHRIEGLTYAQIAERMGLGVKGVEKQIARALVQIAGSMERD